MKNLFVELVSKSATTIISKGHFAERAIHSQRCMGFYFITLVMLSEIQDALLLVKQSVVAMNYLNVNFSPMIPTQIPPVRIQV